MAFRDAAGVIREYVSWEQCLLASDRQQQRIPNLPSDPGHPSDVLLLVPALMTRLCLGRERIRLVSLGYPTGKKLLMHTSPSKAWTAHREQDHSDRRECFLIENSSLKAIDEVRV